VNDKNFVGLSVTGEYIACGSENNSVYMYYHALSKPLIVYKFGSSNPVTVRISLLSACGLLLLGSDDSACRG
jgi:hypothetical protein